MTTEQESCLQGEEVDQRNSSLRQAFVVRTVEYVAQEISATHQVEQIVSSSLECRPNFLSYF